MISLLIQRKNDLFIDTYFSFQKYFSLFFFSINFYILKKSTNFKEISTNKTSFNYLKKLTDFSLLNLGTLIYIFCQNK